MVIVKCAVFRDPFWTVFETTSLQSTVSIHNSVVLMHGMFVNALVKSSRETGTRYFFGDFFRFLIEFSVRLRRGAVAAVPGKTRACSLFSNCVRCVYSFSVSRDEWCSDFSVTCQINLTHLSDKKRQRKMLIKMTITIDRAAYENDGGREF